MRWVGIFPLVNEERGRESEGGGGGGGEGGGGC